MKSFRILGLLLTYPEREMIAALDEMESVLQAECLLGRRELDSLQPLFTRLRSQDLLDLQADYVHLFDRSRQLSLHLYEHLHGDSRGRGEAMTTLSTVYKLNGFELAANELPDYLPLVCEFASLIEEKAARALLADAVDTLAAMERCAQARETDYTAVFSVLIALSARTPDEEEIAAVLAGMASEPESLDELDRDWEEEPVTFGPGAPSCSGLQNHGPSTMPGQEP
ncbi:nitrate reductase molybdenum cofactor assembly chaperone [Fodinicurvata sediminis]|uniref:nitrate reductase molybdenum cofactor assembly chaperone n=1 Tax=Fodinicurvata sediminis TaxID=1121832 RepID=UPI0003B5D7AA|nr:nitrate reductase molybdenum cofactor assembly chaperone [Fodinicurvata sediminis]